MFNRISPLKRKFNEFHDPDYPQQEQHTEDDNIPGCSASFAVKRRKSCDNGQQTEKGVKNENYLNKVRKVIEKEFQREISMKLQQLEEIDVRLNKAKHLLERLRYGIVLAYYKKQEIPLSAADAAKLKDPNSLCEKEPKGPQMPLHPSVKKLIGKRPKDLSVFMRACPKRAAAQNAVQTIRVKSQAQKREERKLKKIIRDQGIVIDHSKQNAQESDVKTLLNVAAQNNLKSNQESRTSAFNEIPKQLSGKSLNASRLNNKIKHLIVVGNTSKYIGHEMEKDIKPNTQQLTHKWLVYVQPKETNQPIERFIKKVRFFLHRSYRPNDVVDIESPPFQVSRRGWGEFPMRVQLFFHPEFHQKPIQLIHNIVLDKTLSGIQTLGAETLLEIWLRDIKLTNILKKEEKTEMDILQGTKSPIKSKTNVTATPEELVDENLLDFLNKIEASPCSISADIEKIQPTVLVNEPLDVKFKIPSPEKCKLYPPTQQKSPVKKEISEETTKASETPLTNISEPSNSPTISVSHTPVSVTVSSQYKPSTFINGSITTKPIMTFVRIPTSSAQIKVINNTSTIANNISEIPPLRPITPSALRVITPNQSVPSTTQKPPIILNKDGRILMPSASVASAVRRTILPIASSATVNISNTTAKTAQISITNKSPMVSIPSSISATVNISNTTAKTAQISITNKPPMVSIPSSVSTTFNAPKQILQKKLVQLVDSTGKVKYIQMLVAASTSFSSINNLKASPVAQKVITMAPSFAKSNTVTNTTQITNTVTTPLLRSPNGAHLIPALTTKPNIFKIVPESMQTKPQIITFSTSAIGTTCTNTVTTANSEQKLLHTMVTNTQTTGQIVTSSCLSIAKPNNLAVANKLQKSNSNAVTATKNLVFQKEGKVYIIDPQQMKYKQQQKKQVSLLKPQISLLKQQQKLVTSGAIISNSTDDTSKPTVTAQLPNNNCLPRIHYGLKQQRIDSINALQLIQMKRILFEKQFLRQEFTNIQAAVEFLLRRLKLVVPKDSLVAAFPFVSHSLQEFHSLTAFKQRAYEWLRAKNISRLLRTHKDLRHLNNTSKENFWSTKEIATFARHYAYTPPIKSLPKPNDQQSAEEDTTKGFTDLVKSELQQENNLEYDTLTDQYKVRKWVDKACQSLESYEHYEDEHQIIDVDSIEEKDNKSNNKTQTLPNTISSSALATYLTPPPHLENQCQLIFDICKDLNVKLEYEELDTNIYHPSTQTILAQCLHLFIEKLLRQSIALKQEKSQVSTSVMEPICTLMPHDLAKVLASNSEFDFLTNNNFGSASLSKCLETSIKQTES